MQPLIPSDILRCDIPAPDTLKSEADAALYIVSLHQAARACAENMQAIQRITEVNTTP